VNGLRAYGHYVDPFTSPPFLPCMLTETNIPLKGARRQSLFRAGKERRKEALTPGHSPVHRECRVRRGRSLSADRGGVPAIALRAGTFAEAGFEGAQPIREGAGVSPGHHLSAGQLGRTAELEPESRAITYPRVVRSPGHRPSGWYVRRSRVRRGAAHPRGRGGVPRPPSFGLAGGPHSGAKTRKWSHSPARPALGRTGPAFYS
jgi:hypothetical protein